jgi:secreted trypsin-like serine protease
LVCAVSVLAAFGAASPSSAIIGGAPAERADYPFFARVGDGKDFCGGSLIAPDRVLTASHCAQLAGIGAEVLIGPDEIRREVARRGSHPVNTRAVARNESDGPAEADLLVLELSSPVEEFAPLPIATPDEGLTAAGTAATVIGFGASKLTRRKPGGFGTFKAAVVAIQDPADCDPLINARWRRWSLCTRDPRLPDPSASRPFASPCFGDSGGPLMVDPGDGLRQVGVVSFGAACGTKRDPEVYANAVKAGAELLSPDFAWAPIPAGRPEISGRAELGRRVRCSVAWEVKPDEVRYTWFAGFGTLREEGPRLRLSDELAGRKLACTALGETDGGYGPTRQSPRVRVRP